MSGNGLVFLVSLAVFVGSVVGIVQSLVLVFASVIVVTLGLFKFQVRTEVQKGFVQAKLASPDVKENIVPICIQISIKIKKDTKILGVIKIFDDCIEECIIVMIEWPVNIVTFFNDRTA